MNNEPVAWMQTWENQNGELKHTVNIEQIGKNDIPLYTHPAQELNDGGEPVKNASYWKRQYNEMSALNDRLKSSLYHANEQIKYLEFHPAKTEDDGKVCARCGAIAYDPVITQTAKTLTDEEIADIISSGEYWTLDEHLNIVSVHFDKFARAILRKAQEK